MSVSASSSLNVAAAAHSVVAELSRLQHRLAENRRAACGGRMLVIWLQGGWGGVGEAAIMPGFASKLYNRIQVLPKAPASAEQIQLRAGGGRANGFHIGSLCREGLSSVGARNLTL